MTAKFIKKPNHFNGEAKMYELSEKVSYADGYQKKRKTKYVVVSAIIAPFTGAETYIFPCDKNGVPYNFGELEGSYRGGLDHEEALRGLGVTEIN